MPLKMTERVVDGVSVLDLEGRIVLGDESSALREQVKTMLGQDRSKIVLNMGQVSYIDSAGLGALVAAYTSAKNSGASLKLINLGSKFREVLQVTKLLTVFEVYDTEQAAIASFLK
ncbi:MAG TPA: STAS domain-containing protein [Candidatus Dormibacteraeota bacterium]|nr:STAS domain-containing protein [Candidatus Dormibacteraeota bacterium]